MTTTEDKFVLKIIPFLQYSITYKEIKEHLNVPHTGAVREEHVDVKSCDTGAEVVSASFLTWLIGSLLHKSWLHFDVRKQRR